MSQLIDLGKLRFYFAGEFNPATTYEMNDVVKYGGNVYIFISSVASSNKLPTDINYWSLMVKGLNFEGAFSPSTSYQVGDGVSHGGKVYIAIANSTGQTPPNATYWSQFVDGIQYEGNYNNLTTYQKNDVVKYGAKVYIAKVDTSGNLPTDSTYWDQFVDGISPEGVYNSSTEYVPGDVVAYGPKVYVAKANTTNNVPTNTTYWDPFISGIDYRNDWQTATQYYVNDVVNRGGATYICLVNHASTAFTTDFTSNKWARFNGGIRVRGTFTPSTQYLIGDLVFDGIDTYLANEEFISGADIDADSTKWDLFAKGADFLPNQPGNEGKLLSTDGVNPLWTYEANKIQIGQGEGTNTASDFETNAALTDVTASFVDSSESFTQIAYQNQGTGIESSADIIIYANNGDNETGFIDMGMTNSTFDSSTYGVTGPGDGYIFVQGVDPIIKTVTDAVLNSNIVTLTTSTAHDFVEAQQVTITGINSIYNGTYSILDTPTPTTFTYSKVNSNVAASSGLNGTAVQSKGRGDLVIATGDKGSRNAIVLAAGGFASGNEQVTIIPDQNVHIEIPTPSTSSSTGALTIVGGVGIQGDLNMDGDLSVDNGGIVAKDTIFVGQDAVSQSQLVGQNIKSVATRGKTSNIVTITTTTNHGYSPFQSVTVALSPPDEEFDGTYEIIDVPTPTSFTYSKPGSNLNISSATGAVSAVTGWTNPMGIFTSNADDYAQLVVQNINNSENSSSDFIAYPDNGTDFSGYIDMGITSSTFNDPEFTITGPNDGYIFMTAPVGTTGNGNLVLATGDTGSENKIVFAAGGLSSNNTQMVITPDENVHIEIATPSVNPSTGALTIVGGVGIQGDVNIAGTISFGGSGTTVTTANLAVSDPLIFVGQDNPQNNYELGIVAEYALPTTLDPVATVIAVELLDNLATLTLTYPVGGEKFRVNDAITVTGIDATFNGSYTVAATTPSTISYVKTASNVGYTTGLNGSVNATNVYRPKWAGFVKDNSDGVWKLVSNIASKPTSGSVNFSGVVYDAIKLGQLESNTVNALTSVTAPNVIVNNQPTLGSHAVRKDYIDEKITPHPFMMAAL